MNYTGPKVRLSRKLGVSLTPKADKFLEKKPYPPGMHGFRRRRRLSPYGTQLLEKQRLRFQYNVSERQLRNYFRRATRRTTKAAKGAMSESASLSSAIMEGLDGVRIVKIENREAYEEEQYTTGHFTQHVNG